MLSELLKKQKTVSFMLVGVGGQGTILASDVIAEVGMNLGYDAKKAEVHGMSQRGGSVTTVVRWAERVYSPIIAKGEADILISFEKAEVGRYIDFLRPGGLVLANRYEIVPITVSSGGATYPTEELINQAIAKYTNNLHWVDGIQIAEEIGTSKAANVVLLGALAFLLGMDPKPWLDAVKKRVPAKFADLNTRAFEAGLKAATK